MEQESQQRYKAQRITIQIDPDVVKALDIVVRGNGWARGDYIEHLLRCDEHIDRVLHAEAREHSA